jgi:hypothetical protein
MAGLSATSIRNCRMGVNISRCSSGVEHFLGKEEVVSSILINGSNEFFEIEWIWNRIMINQRRFGLRAVPAQKF